MHKYGIRMWIALKERESTEYRTIFREAFPVCEFITVTSYQNKKVLLSLLYSSHKPSLTLYIR